MAETATSTAPSTGKNLGELKHVRLENIVLNDKSVAIRGVKMESEKFKDLVSSIRMRGVQTPISLRVLRDPKTGEPTGMFGMVAGLHRYTACSVLKLPTIPALIRDVREDELIEEQLTENIQRIEMRPAEQANAIFKHIASHPDQSLEEVAARFGKSRAWLDQRLSLTRLPTVDTEDIDEETGEPKQPLYGIDVQALVNDGKINPANAYLLSKLVFDPPVPEELWKSAVSKAQTYNVSEYTGWSQIQVNAIKQARKTGGKVVQQNTRVPVLRTKAELATHLQRLEQQVEQLKAASKPVPEFTNGVVSALRFALQIDDKSWAAREAADKAKDAAREEAKANRLAGKFAESLSLGGLIDAETAKKAAAKVAAEGVAMPKEALAAPKPAPVQPETPEELLGGEEIGGEDKPVEDEG